MSKVAIYGVGAFGQMFYHALDGKIDFFIDDFSDKREMFSKPILKKNDVNKSTKIYISVLQYSKKIEQELIDDKFDDIINFTESIKIIPNILNVISKQNYLWLVKDKNRMIDEKKLEKVRELLKDTKSQTLLKQMINLRRTLDSRYYIEPHDTEYFPSDIPMLENLAKINFVDCGAYTGDTIEELMRQTSNVNLTISFEPDETNLHKLTKQLSILKKKFTKTNFIIYPAGVYSSNSILKFANNGIDSSASFDDTSSLEVPVVSLDSTLLNSNVNFIKMDIEGAEYEALLGAKQTIKKYKPNLAICLYHKPEDLWELPLLIKEIEPSYDMYIRVHEDMCLSTVLYCISRSRDV